MRHIIEPGTDGASLCFYDPGAMPSDFDAQMNDDPVETMEALEKSGLFWSTETGGDGGYTIHFYVDEPRPAEVERYCRATKEAASFAIPSGTVWCCGSEYAASDPLAGHQGTPKGGLGKFSGMGGKFETPPGKYSMKAWEVEWPEDYVDERVKKELGPGESRRQSILGPIFGFMFVGGAIGFVFLVFKYPRLWWAWALAAGISVLGLFLAKRLENSPAGRRLAALQREYPNYAVELRQLNMEGLPS